MADAMWFLATAYRIAFQVAGCYIAARLAPVRPMEHALGLGGAGFIWGDPQNRSQIERANPWS